MCAVQPLYGQAADIFGRKATHIAAIVLFLIGSCICGLAKRTAVLVVGRTIQGVGGGGLSIMPSMIISDLVPLRERQKYTGIIYGTFAIGTFIGPVLGGVLTNTIGWRWIFFLVMIIAGLTLLFTILFLRVKYERQGTVLQRLLRIDFVGNTALIPSVTAILLALTNSSGTYSWTSYHVLLPLLLGLLGLAGFLYLQSNTCLRFAEPTVPLRLFLNLASFIAFMMTLLHGLLLYWTSLYLPVYFQAIRQDTPQISGVSCLASAIPLVPAGVFGGILIAKYGKYKLNQICGFILMAVGLGLFSLLDSNSQIAEWIMFQFIFAVGAGLVLTALLPAIQAPLSDDDTAAATATWGFVQAFGFIWGAAIPSAIFNHRVSSLSNHVNDLRVRSILQGGGAYEHASKAFLSSLDAKLRNDVVEIFTSGIKFTWQISIAFSGCGLILALIIPSVRLRKDLNTNFGLDER